MSGIQERYASAVVSSHLETTEADGDIDVIIAAGSAAMSGQGRGAMYARLWREFGEIHATIKRQAPDIGAIDQRLATVLKLRGLTEAKAATADLAAEIAPRIGVKPHSVDLQQVVWQALSIWLDPHCGHCTGRGYTGGYDGPQMQCKPCRSTGQRRGNTGKGDDERRFIDELAMEIQAEMQRFHSRMDARLRERD